MRVSKETLGLGVLSILLWIAVSAGAEMVVYDDFTTLDAAKWAVNGTAYQRGGDKGDGHCVELAAGYQTGQITTQTADFVLPTPAQVGGSLTVQVKYENRNYYSHGYINICAFELAGVDGGEDYGLTLRRKYSNDFRWMWWNNSTEAWVTTGVNSAANDTVQLVRLKLENVAGNLVQSAYVSDDDGLNWTEVFTGNSQSDIWPESVKLSLYENWQSCIIDTVSYENVVPEPATISLLVIGGAAAMLRRKR
ncbi:MAG: PEP-CTERM sorting domain-containing protein [Phycisphaerae bacterium]|nr:PEP-CTERM sorting domain-containing protein [Phycisphaerae bacterium]